MSEMIRLRNSAGADECNARGHAFHVSKWGTFLVPSEDVAPLLRTGGFHVAAEDDDSAEHSTLEDVAEAAWHLPLGRVRDTLLNLLSNTNALGFLAEKARPTVKII